MANINDVKQVFTDIANATRSKTGSSADLKPTQMASAISGIQVGVDTSDATANASDILSGKTAYARGVELTGTYEDKLDALANKFKYQNRGQRDWSYAFGFHGYDSTEFNMMRKNFVCYIDFSKLDLSTTGDSGDYPSPTKIDAMFLSFPWSYYNSGVDTPPLFDTSKVLSAIAAFATNQYPQPSQKLKYIPAYDFSSCSDLSSIFRYQSALKEIHCFGMKVSFDISVSTQFTESALVEILNNLATVSTTQTLTMGNTNLNKLSADEQAIATNKGWTLA